MSTTRNMSVYVQSYDFGRTIGIQMSAPNMEGKFTRTVLKAVETIELEDDAYADPALTLNKKQAQQLIDALWDCGIRPTQGSGSAGSLAATEKHLEDMRQIAMGQLKKAGAL